MPLFSVQVHVELNTGLECSGWTSTGSSNQFLELALHRTYSIDLRLLTPSSYTCPPVRLLALDSQRVRLLCLTTAMPLLVQPDLMEQFGFVWVVSERYTFGILHQTTASRRWLQAALYPWTLLANLIKHFMYISEIASRHEFWGRI